MSGESESLPYLSRDAHRLLVPASLCARVPVCFPASHINQPPVRTSSDAVDGWTFSRQAVFRVGSQCPLGSETWVWVWVLAGWHESLCPRQTSLIRASYHAIAEGSLSHSNVCAAQRYPFPSARGKRAAHCLHPPRQMEFLKGVLPPGDMSRALSIVGETLKRIFNVACRAGRVRGLVGV